MEWKRRLFYSITRSLEKNYICNAVVPCLNQDSGEVQMGEVWNSLNSSVFQNSIVLQKMQNTANSKGEKKTEFPQYAWFSSTGSKYLEPARAENRNIILYSTLAFKSC